MFSVFDSVSLALKVMNGVVETMEVLNCLNALSCDMLATDLAYYLVRKNMPFRDVHQSATKFSDCATEKNRLEINKVSMSQQLREINENFADDEIISFQRSVEQYQPQGLL